MAKTVSERGRSEHGAGGVSVCGCLAMDAAADIRNQPLVRWRALRSFV